MAHNPILFTQRSRLPQGNASGVSNDGTFGPWYSGAFDFTIVFGNIFLGIIPAAIGLLAWPIWLLYYRSKPTVAARDRLLWSKLVGSASTVPSKESLS